MKKPTLKGWLAIIGAVIAALMVILMALSDGVFTSEEAKAVTNSIGEVVETVQQETAEDAQ